MLGVIQFITIAAPQFQAAFSEETVPDWNVVITALLVPLGFAAARDGDVSSESAGAK